MSLDYAGACDEARKLGEEMYNGFSGVYEDRQIQDVNRFIDTSGDSENCAVVYGFEHEQNSMPLVVRVMPLPVFRSEYVPAAAEPPAP